MLLSANWFIGVAWTVGLALVVATRLEEKEAMLIRAFGGEMPSVI